MTWFEATILGLVQGLTEFLPVSSSGHLEIGQALLGTAGEDNLAFSVLLHVATVCSTLLVLWHEVAWLLKGCFTTIQWNKEKDYAAKILVSIIPVFIVGIFFKDKVELFFGNGLLVVGICLLITALLLFVSEMISKRKAKQASLSNAEVGREVGYWEAAVIGCAQAIAVLPGLSRSGTTIATGLLCGVKKSAVAQFSFLMVIIPILGEALLDIVDILQGDAIVATIPIGSAIAGFLAAFLSGCFACKAMIHIVKKQKLSYFAIYCLIIGILAIVIR